MSARPGCPPAPEEAEPPACPWQQIPRTRPARPRRLTSAHPPRRPARPDSCAPVPGRSGREAGPSSASRPCARPGPAPWAPRSNPALHGCQRAAREGEGPARGHPPAGERVGRPKLGAKRPGSSPTGAYSSRQTKPRVSYPATRSLSFPVRKQPISEKNTPFHPPGTLAGKLPGSTAARLGSLGSAKSQLPSALLRSLLLGGGGRGLRPGGEAPRGSRVPDLDCGQGARGAPGPRGLEEPRATVLAAPARAGTRGPRASRSSAPGGVCVSVSSGNGAVAGQPARPRPAAPRGAPGGRGVQMAGGTRGSPRLELLMGLGHLGRPVPAPARREAGHPDLAESRQVLSFSGEQRQGSFSAFS